MGEPSAIVIRDLIVDRGGQRVLRGIELAIPRGLVVGLLGPSGSGKSTLMRAIVGVQIVAGGTVEVLGLPAGAPELRRRLAYVTQAPSIYADLTTRENLRFFARVLGVETGRIAAAIAAAGLADHADRPVNALSGGQRARASLATALLGNPEVLVLDEPTVGQDPVLRHDLWSRFRALAGDGATLLVSSHVMDEAERCDWLILLRDGRVLAADRPDALRERTGARDMEGAFLALARTSEGVSV
jgi:ABC-2 type transport system ATP-binding protein